MFANFRMEIRVMATLKFFLDTRAVKPESPAPLKIQLTHNRQVGEVIYRIPAFNDLRQQPIRKSNRNARDRDRLNITCSFAVLSSRETMAWIPSLR